MAVGKRPRGYNQERAPNKEKGPKKNGEIQAEVVRLYDENDEMVGAVPLGEAL